MATGPTDTDRIGRPADGVPSESPASAKRRELYSFLFILVILIPGLAVGFVAAYGFAVWILQMIFGPPGPPPG